MAFQDCLRVSISSIAGADASRWGDRQYQGDQQSGRRDPLGLHVDGLMSWTRHPSRHSRSNSLNTVWLSMGFGVDCFDFLIIPDAILILATTMALLVAGVV